MGAMKWNDLDRAKIAATEWVVRQEMKTKAVIGAITAAFLLLFLWLFVNDHLIIFMAAECSHAAGISFLVYKLIRNRTCAGLSLKSQELTALFFVLKFYSSFVSVDIHAVLDIATLITTLWVVYMIRGNLKSSYMENEDSFSMQYMVIACALMALIVHPSSSGSFVNRLIIAFGRYLETTAMMPQLHMMHNTKVVESLTAHYVFAMGVARFLNCANWILQIINSRGTLLIALGYGLWPGAVLLSEIAQTLILADFCYYYVKSYFEGQIVLMLPSDTV